MRHLTALAFLLSLASPAFAEVRVVHDIRASGSIGQARRAVIDIPAGEVRVRNGAPGRITVDGVVSRDPDGPRSRAEEQRIVDDIGVAIVARGSEVIVRRQFGPNARSWRAETFTSYDVTIEVPTGMAVDVRTRYGDVEIEGTFGDVDVDLRAGEIDVRVPRSTVRELRASCVAGEVRTNLGDEIITREGLFPGKTRYVNANGTAFINVHTTFGEVRVELTK